MKPINTIYRETIAKPGCFVQNQKYEFWDAVRCLRISQVSTHQIRSLKEKHDY